MTKAIGIDLGTTFSCVSIYDGNKSTVIPNTLGKMITPSFVKFKPNEIIVGDLAKENVNVKDTLFDTKRLIGQNYLDASKINTNFNLKKIGDTFGIKLQNQIITPEQVASHILKYLKHCAEVVLKENVTDAVITVPAYFNNAQRKATIAAGQMAGLKVLRIINEPTAAALAYGLTTSNSHTILIVDCGGGTTDISLIVKEQDTFIVKSTAGDNHLGGRDIDTLILNEIIKQCPDLKLTPKLKNHLLLLCEKIKKDLTIQVSTSVQINSKMSITFTLDQLNTLLQPFFNKISKLVSQALFDGKMSDPDIDYILCVGGTTRIPGLQNTLIKRFTKEKVLCHLNPDEVVSIGASIQAYSLTTNASDNGMTLIDTIPLSLGIKTADGLMQPIIEKNTTKPCKRTQVFSTFKDGQKMIEVEIYEGNRAAAKDNYHLSTFQMPLHHIQPRGKSQIEIIFDVNNDGILTASSIELATGQIKTIEINFDNVLSKEIREKLKDDAKNNEETDTLKRQFIQTRFKLQDLLYSQSDLIPEKLKLIITKYLSLTKINDKILQSTQKLLDHTLNTIEMQLAVKNLF